MRRNRLTPPERKVLNVERRFGILFAVAFTAAGALADLIIYLQHEQPERAKYMLLATSVSLVLALLIYYLVNRKLDRDLWYGNKYIEKHTIRDKGVETHVRGLAVVPGIIDDPRGIVRYYFIVGAHKQFVDKDTYEKADCGDTVELHYAQESKTLLSIKLPE